MNEKRFHELGFWRDLAAQHGPMLEAFRASELVTKTKNFPSFRAQQGKGLDLGCGLVSVLRDCGKEFIAADPLYEEFKELWPFPGETQDGENLTYADNTFDWVFCVNTIDHTPNPQKMVDEIHRVLKPGGVLYFEVNFDQLLATPHYGLWNEAMVREHLKNFKELFHMVEVNEGAKQALWWGEYAKV